MPDIVVVPIGVVRSPLTDPREAPRQPDEGAPQARIVLTPEAAPAAADLRAGHRIVVLTWLDRADRATLRVRPRDDPGRAETGVFSTRSQDRPNPIGLHEVTVTEVTAGMVTVAALEALDGTPVLDIKPVLTDVQQR
ncbi:tRNA (N6-threonylcarbamoyladenosine(37)-N6)-methyltransferase TrmO [Actinoplanes sp. NPDC004185]